MLSSCRLDDVSDGHIARRIANAGLDSRSAETALCRRFGARIRLYGLRHLGDEDSAADLVQQVLVCVLQALREGRVDKPDSIGGFVLATCRNIANDIRRAERRQRAIEAQALDLDTVQPPPWTETDFIRLFGCVMQLAERERLIVRMTYMEDRTSDEIATRTGMTAGNVRVSRHRALARLHDCLERGSA